MRATMFAAGLVLASNTAFAQAQEFTPTPPDNRVTLTNGCVYMHNELAQGNEWSLIYTEAGTTVQCPLTIYGLVANDPQPLATEHTQAEVIPAVTRTQITPDIGPRPRLSFIPGYMVGVFR